MYAWSAKIEKKSPFLVQKKNNTHIFLLKIRFFRKSKIKALITCTHLVQFGAIYTKWVQIFILNDFNLKIIFVVKIINKLLENFIINF